MIKRAIILALILGSGVYYYATHKEHVGCEIGDVKVENGQVWLCVEQNEILSEAH